MASQFGTLFRISTFGESHGIAVGCVVDGCPPGLALDESDIQTELDRRRPGQSRIVTQRKEADRCQIQSGVYEGRTLGTPISIVVMNQDQRSDAYKEMESAYRPSHADYTYDQKYGLRAVAGGGRSSARETIARVAAGAIARKVLESQFSAYQCLAFVKTVAGIEATVPQGGVDPAVIESNIVRTCDPVAAEKMIELIEKVRGEGDSVGGVVECHVRGVPTGLGEPVFDKLEADLAKAMLSLPATKGFEIGSGFGGTLMTGLQHNDEFYTSEDGRIRTQTNRSGGVQGGISNGEDIIFRVAFKPTATVLREQNTVTSSGEATTLKARGRHDPCVLPRAVPIVEAMVHLVLCDHWLRQQALRAASPL
ncbi:chorismate synthase [Phragmitibacter flavus]|uniref:Chorismate synthase n=1 Tax=Phragmitibacter flavus TaxID=2576071 RepID=A0A5R8KK78_9BACT|nr:chorismate synthase [Phragmitibacter flavus]TLD72702.1 chorismate synthase [Phragmitibacter flavus]